MKDGGVGPVPLNIADGMRLSTAICYILPRIGRANLDIKGNVFVRRVVIERGRAVGVEADVRGERVSYRGGEVIVSCGALRSPHLLMLSGIGPADQLRGVGVAVIADLPGVGQNLSSHPEALAGYRVAVDIPEMPGRGTIASALHWTAESSTHPSDLEVFPFLRPFREMTDSTSAAVKRPVRTLRAMRGTSIQGIASHALTRTTGFAALGLQQEESRGEVRLASSNPRDNPTINYNILAEPEDRRRIIELATVWSRIFETDAMASIGGELTDLHAADLATPDAIAKWFGSHLLGAAHPSSTCKIGRDTDPMAVVDQYGRVNGVAGLRVADTSIFPMVPSRGTNATAVMTGERIAAFIDEGG